MGIGEGGGRGGEGIYTVRVHMEFHLYSSPPHGYSIDSPSLQPPPPSAHTYIVEINSDLKGTKYIK